MLGQYAYNSLQFLNIIDTQPQLNILSGGLSKSIGPFHLLYEKTLVSVTWQLHGSQFVT